MAKFRPLALLALAVVIGTLSSGWGFWAHQRINRLAVYTLPPDMLRLYKKHIEYMTEHAVDPDKRRYAVEWEAPRHYMDVDHYGEYPFEMVPRKWNDAVEKYSEDTLNAYGIVPWHIQRDYNRLVKAFMNQDLKQILKISADIGHYIADSNVPLHTTENYNGQLTGQKGIHGLWESRLPEIFGQDYNYFVGRAEFIEDPLEEAWKTVLESHACLDSVLGFEASLTKSFPSDKKYSYENRNAYLTRVYSHEFSMQYHEMLKGQVERRMRTSIIRVGSCWFCAGVESGQPHQNQLLLEEVEYEKEKLDKKLKIEDREQQDVGYIEQIVPGFYEKWFGKDHEAVAHVCGHGH